MTTVLVGDADRVVTDRVAAACCYDCAEEIRGATDSNLLAEPHFPSLASLPAE